MGCAACSVSFFERNQANLKAEFYLPTAVNTLIQERRARVKVLPTPLPLVWRNLSRGPCCGRSRAFGLWFVPANIRSGFGAEPPRTASRPGSQRL